MTAITPIDAALLAAELTDHMDVLSSLDLHPDVSAGNIARHRVAALQLTEQLTAYLLMSSAFDAGQYAPESYR
jgi:hypothetical protein